MNAKYHAESHLIANTSVRETVLHVYVVEFMGHARRHVQIFYPAVTVVQVLVVRSAHPVTVLVFGSVPMGSAVRRNVGRNVLNVKMNANLIATIKPANKNVTKYVTMDLVNNVVIKHSHAVTFVVDYVVKVVSVVFAKTFSFEEKLVKSLTTGLYSFNYLTVGV